jgi:hypothetical protein
MKRPIYPATRAVENAVSLPGVRPVRLFPVLWPLWQVETSAIVHDKQDFEVIDHFIVRAIHEGGIRDRGELIRFLNLPAALTDRCLRFLATIGHVTLSGSTVDLTEIGQRSARDGVRYVSTTSRLTILIERQTGWPLPRPYYDANVPVLDTPEVEDGARFLRVFSGTPYDPATLARLASSPDRARYNLPSQFRDPKDLGHREGYLPCYLIETADRRILAYTNLAPSRDAFLEQVCAKTSVEHLIEAKGLGDPEATWRKWLATQSAAFQSARLQAAADGWRVVLPESAFGDPPDVPLTRIGAYQFRDNHFIQIWCADPATRRRALTERSLGIATLPDVTDLADLEARIRDLARALEVPEVTVADLRRNAQGRNDERLLTRFARLGRDKGARSDR